MDKSTINNALAFLAKKIDELKEAVSAKSVNIDMGKSAETIGKSIAKPVETKMDKVISVIDEQTRTLGSKNNSDIVQALENVRKELKRKDMRVNVAAADVKLDPLEKAIANLGKEIQKTKTDNSDVVKMLKEVKSAVLDIKMPEVSVGKELARLEEAIADVAYAVNKNKPEKLSDKFDAIEQIFNTGFKGMKPKESVRIDDNQMKALMAALTNNDPAPHGGFYASRKVVTTAGTPVKLSDTSVRCENITITSESDNTGYIAVGDANVVAAEGSQQGAILTPLGSVTIRVSDLSHIYIDSTVNGEGVTFSYER